MRTLRTFVLCLLSSVLCAFHTLRADTVVFTGGDYTGDIYLADRTDTFVVDADTTISGRITGTSDYREIATGGAFIKTGDGTLSITGQRNWFLGPNAVSSGTLVVTHVGALGTGNLVVNSGATFVMRGIRDGMNFPQAITGGGRVEIADSDMTLNYRHGFVIGALASANSDFSELAVTRSRLYALASGTLSSGLGGANVAVSIADNSTLVLGREGITPGVSGLLAQTNYAIVARILAVDATSTLMLNPGANLTVTGTLALDPDATFTFGGAGLIRLEYAALAPGSASPDILAAAPAGYSLDATSVVGSSGRQRRDYLVINQGANPMHDIAMTTAAIDTIIDTVSGRLNELFLLPAADAPAQRRPRKWNNNAWLRGLFSSVDYETGGDNRPGHNGRLSGLVLGLDSAYRQRVNLGLYGGITESNLDTAGAASLLSKQRYFGVSVTPRFKHFYITADAFSGNADSESLRREANGSTIAHWSNHFSGGGLEVGAVLRPWKDGFLRPRVAVRYTSMDISDYKERAPIGASQMVVEDFSDSLAHVNLAVDAARRLTLFKRAALAGVSLGLKRHVSEPRTTLAAAFRDYSERGFTLERGDYYEDTVSLGASLGVALTRRVHAGLSLGYERGAHHDRMTASLSVNCMW
ncbi:MAG: autotransporter domain-containing protein [Opitutaceae bacterium]|jgi:hypothetical protein|nr:autotransporter domain-containing protein [Opitutaceae bacterium]